MRTRHHTPQDPVNELRDIHATLGNPWWPPAPGWWLLLGALVLLGLLLWRSDLLWRLRVPIPMITWGSWRWDAAQALGRLRREAATAPVKQVAAQLSELLRRIAMARHSRAECAGLHGDAWLAWLAAQDPKGFDWRSRGRLLLLAPYAPPKDTGPARAELLALIDAAMEWATAGKRKPEPDAARPPGRLRRTWSRLARPLRRRGRVKPAASTAVASTGATGKPVSTPAPASANAE